MKGLIGMMMTPPLLKGVIGKRTLGEAVGRRSDLGFNSLVLRSFATTSEPKKRTCAVVFDIDGVIHNGGVVLPGAKEAVQKVVKDKIPHIFLTNGGGVHESTRAAQLSALLGFEVESNKILLSHTPCRDYVREFHNKLVLIAGGRDRECGEVARSYGFNNAITVEEVAFNNPSLNPLLHYPPVPAHFKPKYEGTAIEMVMVFHEPVSWNQDLQVLLDVARSNGHIGQLSDTQVVPFVFTNPDIVYSSNYHIPRLAQGSFRLCLETIFFEVTGRKLQYKELGKPNTIAYTYAKNVLTKQAVANNMKLGTIYTIGDNPKSDIKGSNSAGDSFFSILTRTGVFKSKADNDVEHPAKKVVPDIVEAVNFIYKKEGLPEVPPPVVDATTTTATTTATAATTAATATTTTATATPPVVEAAKPPVVEAAKPPVVEAAKPPVVEAAKPPVVEAAKPPATPTH